MSDNKLVLEIDDEEVIDVPKFYIEAETEYWDGDGFNGKSFYCDIDQITIYRMEDDKYELTTYCNYYRGDDEDSIYFSFKCYVNQAELDKTIKNNSWEQLEWEEDI